MMPHPAQSIRTLLLLLPLLALGGVWVHGADPGAGESRGRADRPQDQDSAIVLVAGDIASCEWRGDEATAALLDSLAGTILTVGDNVYPHGTAGRYQDCYEPSWGRHKTRTRPTIGNHDFTSPEAAPYYAYFGKAAGPPSRGYYSFDVGDWHVVSLNSLASVEPGSPQVRWLREDLADSGARCVLAAWHHPRFSSGMHRGVARVAPLWEVLYETGAEIVVQGHDHNYERFAPLTPMARVDEARGIRSFVVGTGGAPLRRLLPWRARGSQVRLNRSHGVLKLTLLRDRYRWEFVGVGRARPLDRGEGRCH